jgi:hypothetical protein
MPDFDQLRADARHRSDERKAAFEATRARADGKTKAEIREICVSELQARGLNVPAYRILDAVAERVAGNPIPAARVAGESLVQISKRLRDLARIFTTDQDR